jgi:uncharacterized protein (DUF736 family)
LIQKQEGQGSEVFEERSVVDLHEHRENETNAEIRSLSITSKILLIQKQEGQGSEVFEERSVVDLHEHRENETNAEIRSLSINKQKERTRKNTSNTPPHH